MDEVSRAQALSFKSREVKLVIAFFLISCISRYLSFKDGKLPSEITPPATLGTHLCSRRASAVYHQIQASSETLTMTLILR
jgi:hypothetical protein